VLLARRVEKIVPELFPEWIAPQHYPGGREADPGSLQTFLTTRSSRYLVLRPGPPPGAPFFFCAGVPTEYLEYARALRPPIVHAFRGTDLSI